MKKIFLFIFLSTQLFAITEEQYHEFMNDMKIKIGVHTYYNNIYYNGKYLVNNDRSRFFNTDINNQYNFNSHFSSGFNIELEYKNYFVEYNMQMLENNFSTPTPLWSGGVHKDAYKIVVPGQVWADSLYGLENSNKTYNVSFGYTINDNYQIILDWIYLKNTVSNSSAYNNSWMGDNWIHNINNIYFFGIGGKINGYLENNKYKISILPIFYPYCIIKKQFKQLEIFITDTIPNENIGFTYSLDSTISTNWSHLNFELGYKIQHVIQDKNFDMFTKGVTFETSWTF